MPPEASWIVRSWRVGAWTATFSAVRSQPGRPVHAFVEWAPSMPNRGFTPRELAQYQGGLARATADVADALGVRFATAEELP
jgi:hypothetical protein